MLANLFINAMLAEKYGGYRVPPKNINSFLKMNVLFLSLHSFLGKFKEYSYERWQSHKLKRSSF
jgi:hypothetical protein